MRNGSEDVGDDGWLAVAATEDQGRGGEGGGLQGLFINLGLGDGLREALSVNDWVRKICNADNA